MRCAGGAVLKTLAQLERWRSETPGVANVVHLNNAGAGLMPRPVLDTMLAHLQLEAEMGGYEAAALRSSAIDAVYGSVARLLGAAPRNVALVENATVGFWQALSAFDFRPGDRILTTQADYASHQLTYLSLRSRRGIEIAWAPDAADGGIDIEAFQRELAHPRTRLAVVCWSPNSSGLIQDAPTLTRLCRQAGVPSIVDACQAVGQLPIEFAALGCDFLSGTARKFLRGPRGIGFLLVADHVLEAGRYPLFVDGRGATWQERERFELEASAKRFENWEFSYALVLGLGRAAEYALEVGVEAAATRAAALAAALRAQLSQVPGVVVLDRGRRLGAIVTAAIGGWGAPRLVAALHAHGVNGNAATRAWALRDLEAKGVDSALRLSPHYYNTEAELERAVAVLAELAR